MSRKPKHITSAGVEVNYDLIRAKQQMAEMPASAEVQERQERINARLRRKMNALGPTRKKIKKDEVKTKSEKPEAEKRIIKEEKLVEEVESTDVENEKEVVKDSDVDVQSNDKKSTRGRQKAKPPTIKRDKDDDNSSGS